MADLSAFASAFDVEEVAEDRMPHRGDKAASEEYGWWFAYGPDSDFDGLDDRLEEVIAGKDSPSPTSIIGEDGHNTVAIIVDFAWHPTDYEIEQLVAILENHGWESEGSWFQVMDSIDSIVVDHVPVSAILEIHALESVVVVEMQNVMTTFLSTASPASRVRPSEVYGGTLYDRGYTGEGIVIAVLDSGVDNEHRSLNDFDDQDDDPDLDANSYDDQKWVAGYDATSQASNPDGSQDPDDGQGHGTHVAGIALGTGDARGIDMGTAPGAYLVDVKVLTDSGGTNSQNSINGIQWVINNRDTNWGNGAIGIQIAQMSFGSIGNQLDPNDDGDNGTGAEARLVNNATVNGISCIVAAGNDGKRRIPSPASADGDAGCHHQRTRSNSIGNRRWRLPDPHRHNSDRTQTSCVSVQTGRSPEVQLALPSRWDRPNGLPTGSRMRWPIRKKARTESKSLWSLRSDPAHLPNRNRSPSEQP